MKKYLVVLGVFAYAACKNMSGSGSETELRQQIAMLQDSLRACQGKSLSSSDAMPAETAPSTEAPAADATESGTAANSGTAESGTTTTRTKIAKIPLYHKNYTPPSRSGTKTPGMFPEGTDRTLTNNDVRNLSKWGLKIMENEIYARHGMYFKDENLRDHFAGEDWYHGMRRDVNGSLTNTERQNLAFLQSYNYTPEVQSGNTAQ